jgi:Nucleotidyl transferase AbiEii toxin, Type IV TA system
MKRPTRATAAGQAYLDLQNRARAEGRATQELLTLYVVERWLARLSMSPYADQFIMKGGMLLAAYDARRPTADLDALAHAVSNDQAAVMARVIEIAHQTLADDDGVEYRADTVSSRIIRDEALYSGVRIAMDCAIATAVVKFRLDVNFGDPVTPAPRHLSLPSLQPGMPPVRVLGYPIETVLAEKITTAIGLGPANTRVRDYADIYTLTRNWPVDHAPPIRPCSPPLHSAAPRSRRSPPRLITSLTSASRPTRPTGQTSAPQARICRQISARW